jgi:beta-glucosidase
MSLEEKVGQMIQAEIQTATPEDAARYHLGSMLNGGGSPPGGQLHAPITAWRAMTDAYRRESVKNGGVPILFGTDAVHGHNNVFGAVLFPHNIGLGAANDPELVEAICRATARDVRASGIDWVFAPTLAVADNPRWGRTYESYSENPAIVARLGEAMVRGLQGAPGSAEQFDADHVIATAKHYIGDGATRDGVDQGDAQVDEAALRDRHAAGYYGALKSDVQTVMASFSSWNGEKMHGQKHLLTDVLKGEMGFDGLVVSDWNGIGQVKGCTAADCPAAINAGVDLIMAPTDWKAAYATLLAQAKSGVVPMSRIDDAVSRILRVKVRAGLFEEAAPSTRNGAPRTEQPGDAQERELARRAVRESLVLLKNRGHALPFAPSARLLVVGEAARSIPRQTGGWSLTWQGSETVNSDFPGATTLFDAVAEAARKAGGSAVFSSDGAHQGKIDGAIVVLAEQPYAEGRGDVPDLALRGEASALLDAVRRLKAEGTPVIAVLYSGRPLYVSPILNAADAFVAAWLPGVEGEGVADMIVQPAKGAERRDFRGRLPFPWPDRPEPPALHDGKPDHALFPIGYGLGLASPDAGLIAPEPAPLAADPGADLKMALYERGPVAPVRLFATEAGAEAVVVSAGRARTASGALTVSPADHRVQEDAVRAVWSGAKPARLSLASETPVDLAPALDKGWSLVFEVRPDAAPTGPVRLASPDAASDEGGIDLGPLLAKAEPGRWITIAAPLSRLSAPGATKSARAPFILSATGKVQLSISDVRLSSPPAGAVVP